MKILRNIDSSVKIIKLISLFVILFSFLFSVTVFIYAMNEIEVNRNKVYLLNKGTALELVRSRNTDDNIKAEVKNHVTMFHEFFFNIDPDPKDIKSRINLALHLIDEGGKLLESQRNENLYYHKLIEGSITSRFYLDSIQLEEKDDLYYCKLFGKQKLERSSKLVLKNLFSECRVRKVIRTDNNPHGLLIENYNITNNNTLYEKNK